MMGDQLRNREVIFEFHPIGNVVRVSAMDVATTTEIAIQCPVGTPDSLMKSNALKRLEYVMKKKNLF